MYFLIKVKNPEDVGKNEEERFYINRVDPSPIECAKEWGRFNCNIHGVVVHPATRETRTYVKQQMTEQWYANNRLEQAYTIAKNQHETLVIIGDACKNLQDRVEELEQKFEASSEYDKIVHNEQDRQFAELEQAFESECDHYDGCLKNIKQEVSELQQAFVKYAICKPTELPRGGKGYIVAEPIERGKFVYTDSCGKVRECSKENITPHGITEQADGILKWTIPADKTNVEGTVIFDPKNPTELMTIEEAERQKNVLIEKNDELVSNPIWNISCHYEIANNINKIFKLEEWIKNQKNTLPEPDIVEQIKAGEKRLLELWDILKNKSSTYHVRAPYEICQIKEYESLCEHTMKLVSIYTKLPIGRIIFDEDKVTYAVYRKGFTIEFQ